MDIRPIDHRDPIVASAIVGLQRRSYGVEARLVDFDAIPNLTESVDEVRSLPLRCAGAFDEDVMLGFVGYRLSAVAVDLDRLAVEPRAFRRGIGTALLRFVLESEGNLTYLVSTGAANTPAVTLYQKLGFRQTGERIVAGKLRVVDLELDPVTITSPKR